MKPFDQNLYNLNDRIARDKVLGYLNSWKDNADKYGPDLVFVDGSLIEVEVKKAWSGPNFPYPTIQLPGRKGKWRELPIKFFVLNRELTYAVVIFPSSLTDDRLKEVPNHYVPNGELFYSIPLTECKIVALGGPANDEVDSGLRTWSSEIIAGADTTVA